MAKKGEKRKFGIRIDSVAISTPPEINVVIGQAHFLKTIEDLFEAVVTSSANAKFGIAFCESSGPCLIRCEGNDPKLTKLASSYALKIGAGHSFIMFLRNAYPINISNAIKDVPEVCNIFCATANDVEVITAETKLGRGILGVIDGLKPKGIEGKKERKERKAFLRKIGYKL
jgi:adenosine/AMP kinase